VPARSDPAPSVDRPGVLLLDVMGTLVRDPFPDELARFFGTDVAGLLAELDGRAWVEFELGGLGEDAFLPRLFRDRRAYDRAGFRAAVRRAYRWMPGMEAVCRDLREAGRALHAFSNYPVWHRWIEEELGLSRYLDWSFVSCETGLRKPDPAAYRLALERLGGEPSRCVLVDDRPENCRAAVDLGMGAVRFRDAGSLRAELVRLGVLSA